MKLVYLGIKKCQLLTGVWQNGGISAKLNFCTSINISANLNISTSNPPHFAKPKNVVRHANSTNI